jgi:hypothetical protein
MMADRDVETLGRRMALRLVAWGLLLLGIVCFVYVSPKTPVEFFDASVHDNDACQRRLIERYRRIDPARAEDIEAQDEFFSICNRMERIALLHDLATAPKRVEQERSHVIGGVYWPLDGTHEALLAENDAYRVLAKEREVRRVRLHERNASSTRPTHDRDPLLDRASFGEAGEDDCLRNFQAWLFWREGN